MADKQVVVGYWGVAGLGNQIRYLLSYVGADFKDEIYTEREKWFQTDKTGLQIPLPNLPYLIDGDFKLSESSAIVRYIPRKFGKPELLGKTVEDQARVDQVFAYIVELGTAFVTALKGEGFQEKKAEIFEKDFKTKFTNLQNLVQENYALGYLTIVDFRLGDFVYIFSHLFPEESKAFPKLLSIQKTFHELPEIKKYLSTGVRNIFPPFIPINLQLPGGN